MLSTQNNRRPILSVDRLGVIFDTPDGAVSAVQSLSFDLYSGQTLGIVGESGSGKSQTVLAMMKLLATNARTTGSVYFGGRDILGLSERELRVLRGNRIAMVFQDPMTALNPYLPIAKQMTEVLVRHQSLSRRDARIAAIRALDMVQIPDAARRIDLYPHEFSGGMRQRVMISMALLCKPSVLLADEPTTALDVTVQAQILALLRSLQREVQTAIVLVTHDLGVVAESCDAVVVLYGGRVMEQASVDDLFSSPRHPYTCGLIGAVPRLDREDCELKSIPGNPPLATTRQTGCAFSPRCSQAISVCKTVAPASEISGNRIRACHLPVSSMRSVA